MCFRVADDDAAAAAETRAAEEAVGRLLLELLRPREDMPGCCCSEALGLDMDRRAEEVDDWP